MWSSCSVKLMKLCSLCFIILMVKTGLQHSVMLQRNACKNIWFPNFYHTTTLWPETPEWRNFLIPSAQFNKLQSNWLYLLSFTNWMYFLFHSYKTKYIAKKYPYIYLLCDDYVSSIADGTSVWNARYYQIYIYICSTPW